MAFVDVYGFEETACDAPAVSHTNTQRMVGGYVSLLPRGDIWPRDEGTPLWELCDGLSMENERTHEAVRMLLDSRDPRKAYDLLVDWEDALTLPDASLSAQTIEQRQIACYEKLTTPGAIDPDGLIAIAASLGYVIELEHAGTVTDPAWCGEALSGETVCMGSEYVWHHVIVHVTAGGNNAQLEAAIARVFHNHGTVSFQYDL